MKEYVNTEELKEAELEVRRQSGALDGSVQGAAHEGRKPLCDGAAQASEKQAYLSRGQRDVLAGAEQAVVLLLLAGRG